MDRDIFFREATRRICGSLDLEKAFWDCLLYIQDYLPADWLSLHLLDHGLGLVETVVDVSAENGPRPADKKTVLPAEIRELVHGYVLSLGGKPAYRIIEDLSQDELSNLVGLDLGSEHDAAITFDLILEDQYLGVAAVTNSTGRKFTPEHAELLISLHDPLAVATANFLRLRELAALRDRLVDDKRFLQDELLRSAGEEVVGADFGLKGVMEQVQQVAPLDSPVLLLGETGAGKEVIAGAIHRSSWRREGPFIKVNCGGIPPSLMDSELFGHEKGAFTGAISRRLGCFERAHGGTIFLDEVGELTPEAQVRLLRVLQEKVVQRVGGSRSLEVDIRVIAATHRDLEAMMDQGAFRQDLYFRLEVFPIEIPPLRERMADLPPLVHHLIRKKAREMALPAIPAVAPGAVDNLMSYDWPGNVRELANAVEHAIIVSRGQPLTFREYRRLGAPAERPEGPPGEEEVLSLDQAMIVHITRVLRLTGGKVEGPGGAAEILGLHPRTLQHRMKKLGIPFGRQAKHLYQGHPQ